MTFLLMSYLQPHPHSPQMYWTKIYCLRIQSTKQDFSQPPVGRPAQLVIQCIAFEALDIDEKPMSKTATLNLRIDADLKAAFSKLAEREERSTAYMVELAMRDRLAFEAAQVRAIEVGLEQANRGEVVPHSAVKEWAKNLGIDAELPLPTSKTNPL